MQRVVPTFSVVRTAALGVLLVCSLGFAGCATTSGSAASAIGGGTLASLTSIAPGSYRRVSSADAVSERVVQPTESLVLAQLQGPGVIDRIWVGVEGSDTFWRDIVLQISWDGANAPSVEVPLGDFFAVGLGARQNYSSAPMMSQSGGRALTSLWKMPFKESATITLVNQGGNPTRQLRYEIDYRELDSLPSDSLYFHARYVQATPPEEGQPLTVLRASGTGQYVGMVMAVQNAEPGSWGGGSVHFEVDGSDEKGPGSLALLNYFGTVFGVGGQDGLYQGSTLDEGDRARARSTVYRFHIPDPVPFESSIEVRVDHGTDNLRGDSLSAVSYWYQADTAVPFERLAGVRDRRWTPSTRNGRRARGHCRSGRGWSWARRTPNRLAAELATRIPRGTGGGNSA